MTMSRARRLAFIHAFKKLAGEKGLFDS